MATVFGARQRFTFSPNPSASADGLQTISRSVTKAIDVLNGPAHADAPRPFVGENASPTAACWILHAR